jgi:hypothetical protein
MLINNRGEIKARKIKKNNKGLPGHKKDNQI